jgi:phosphopantetheinyl transferase (holo-ACP synthase)
VPETLRGAPAPGVRAELIGVGIDIEQPGRFSHLGESMLRRAAARWLSQDERQWCALQPCCDEAMIVVLSCKEAMYKAWPRPGGAHEVDLAMRGSAAAGRATCDRFAQVRLEAAWRRAGDNIVTLAVAARGHEAGELLECFLADAADTVA